MDFKQAAILGSCMSKDYAEDLFALLVTYRNISASEAASRLSLHIKTVQDFLEDLFALGIVDREEVYEGKRPYFRYKLKVRQVKMNVDLSYLFPGSDSERSQLKVKIREKQNARARFTTSRSNDYISSVVIWTGEGRGREERKLNLSIPQGKFLFHLPFPSAEHMSIEDIIHKAGLDSSNISEILDIVKVLIGFGVIENIDPFIQA
jgi:DNA-binding Lrp family transcriptional regulator